MVVDEEGRVDAVEPAPADATADGWLALPGMPNAHSHAFQRALAGFGESAGGDESFWGWRRAMYRLANALSPDEVGAVARQAYGEMLAAGFTTVAEFHYLHGLDDGGLGLEMAHALVEAAADVGLPLVLLPSLYVSGGFGRPPEPEQERFVHRSLDHYFRLLESLLEHRGEGRLALGAAPHSLRAVPPELLPDLLQGASELLGPDCPVHIHVSEQVGEVEECLEERGRRPIQVLSEHVRLGRRWSLVHATHASKDEQALIRATGVTVILCPLTEAYLGDGMFPADEHFRVGGRIAIGSDSNVRIDPVEELRTLELGQRLRTRRRPRLATGEGLGAPLWRWAAEGGGRALGEPVGAIEPGRRADLVVLQADGAPWVGHGPRSALDAFVLGGSRHDVAAVYVGGERVAEGGRRRESSEARAGFRAVVERFGSLVSPSDEETE